MSAKRINTKEAAKITGLSAHSITIFRQQGLISFIRVGTGRGHILFDPEVLLREIEAIGEQNKLAQREAYEKYCQEHYTENLFKGSVLK